MTHRFAGSGGDADLVFPAQSEDAGLLGDLAQELEALERGEDRGVGLLSRAGRRRVHHHDEELELVRDGLERSCENREKRGTWSASPAPPPGLSSDLIRRSRNPRHRSESARGGMEHSGERKEMYH